MGRIGYCEVCGVTEQRRAAEIYDGIDNEPNACWQCEPALKFEQERIIKLLKSFCKDDPDCQKSPEGYCGAYDAEIALIKGEK